MKFTNTNPLSSSLVSQMHADTEFVTLVEAFSEREGLTWVRDRDAAGVTGSGKVVFFLTFRRGTTGAFQGRFACGFFEEFSGDLKDMFLNEAHTLETSTFAHFAEFFGVADVFTAKRFRFFPHAM